MRLLATTRPGGASRETDRDIEIVLQPLSYVPSFSLPSPWFLVVGDALPVLPPAFPSVSVDDRGGVPSGSNACVGQIARIRHVGMAGGEQEIRHGPELGAAARVMIRCAAARVSLTLHNEQ